MPNLLIRPRRLRRSAALRSLVRETQLTRDDFVLPLFVCAGSSVRREVSSMPGVFNLSVDEVTKEASAAFDAGLRGVIPLGCKPKMDDFRRYGGRSNPAGHALDPNCGAGVDHHGGYMSL